jgi:RNAse (barnase) inhibitor barstar
MIDDIQFKSQETFYTFMSQNLGLGTDGITDEDKLYDVISEYKEPLEIVIHDYDDIDVENRKFAKKMVQTIMDCRMANRKLKVTFQQGEECLV